MNRAVILAFAIAACDVGTVVPNNGMPDAPGSASGSNCDQVATALPGHHNAGMTCLQAGCHLPGQAGAGAPEYSYGGTLYKDAQGTMPYGGATIEIVVGGQTHKAVTTDDGNFSLTQILAPAPTGAATGKTTVSACPSSTPMSDALTDGGGNCNNCHHTGGMQPPLFLQ
jgi:hypothetical protein